jgi:hypothetical protein
MTKDTIGRPAKNQLWAVYIGNPTKANNLADASLVKETRGRMMPDLLLFPSRADARVRAKEWARENRFWHFHAAKFLGKGVKQFKGE